MENIHIIPTDKPSRLGRFIDTNNLFLRVPNDIPRGINVNIYITSDEKPNGEDWFYNPFINEIQINCNPDGCKKIILTTDVDLINDGVQAIDDEFLKWFVKNPSCEFVEVNKEWNEERIIDGKDIGDYSYKIIIPQEEQIKVNMNYTDKEIILIKQRAYDKGILHGVAIVAVVVLIHTILNHIFS